MELNQLETFLAVAEERSFSRAAVRLHRTQPAVSQVIRKARGVGGETLFDRAARDGSLTAAGVLLRDYALRLLALRREASSALGELKSLERGHLQLAATSTPVVCCRHRRLSPRVSARERDRAPDAGVADSRELSLRTFELGVISFRPDPAQFRTIAVYADSLAFIVGPQASAGLGPSRLHQRAGERAVCSHNVTSHCAGR